jgi:hypothetical protein
MQSHNSRFVAWRENYVTDICKLDLKDRVESDRLPLPGCVFVAIGDDASLAEIAIAAGRGRPRDLIASLPPVGELGWSLRRCYEAPIEIWDELRRLTREFLVDPLDYNTLQFAPTPTYDEKVLKFIDEALALSQSAARELWSAIVRDRELKAQRKAQTPPPQAPQPSDSGLSSDERKAAFMREFMAGKCPGARSPWIFEAPRRRKPDGTA